MRDLITLSTLNTDAAARAELEPSPRTTRIS
jgi:hypothetical protein